jgi:hypothetical protein
MPVPLGDGGNLSALTRIFQLFVLDCHFLSIDLLRRHVLKVALS